MIESVLKDAEKVLPYIEQVRNLADAHRRELAFLPESVYFEAAIRGNLWVSVDELSHDLQGYLLLGGQHPRMKVFHICVHPDHRASGIGQTLVSELIQYSTDRGFLNITARVSSKLKANGFWRSSGFHIVKQIPGAAAGTIINIYSYDLDVPSLFGSELSANQSSVQIDSRRPLLPTPSYVIDLNVFFDVIRNRDRGQGAQIVSLALKHEIRLYVTTEFAEELVDCNVHSCTDVS